MPEHLPASYAKINIRGVAMQYKRNSKIGLIIFTTVLLCTIFASQANAAGVIYSNIFSDNYVYPPGNGLEVIDYGTTTSGGTVTQFTFGYAADHYGTRSATVRFY